MASLIIIVNGNQHRLPAHVLEEDANVKVIEFDWSMQHGRFRGAGVTHAQLDEDVAQQVVVRKVAQESPGVETVQVVLRF